MRGDFHDMYELTPERSGQELRAQVRVAAVVSAMMAIWISTRIAAARPSSIVSCVFLAFIPAALAVLALVLFMLAHALGGGGWGPGRRGDDGPDGPSPGPRGDLDLDWDEFERDFRLYAERQPVR